MIEFIEKYKNSEDILKENIKNYEKCLKKYEEVGEENIKQYYPYLTYSLNEMKQGLKLAKKYYRNLKKGIKN